MIARLQAAPWWVLALIQGTFFGVFMALFGRLNDPDVFGGGVPGLIIWALVAGVPFGLIMSRVTARMNRRARTAAGVDDSRDMAIVSRAAARGPAPTDPRLRVAAHDLARHRLDELRRKRVSTLTVFGLLTLGYVAAAVFWTPWWALAAIMFAGFTVWSVVLPGRLQRRIDVLSEPF